MHDDEWQHRRRAPRRRGLQVWGVGALASLVALPAVAALLPTLDAPVADPCARELRWRNVLRYEAAIGDPPATVLTLHPSGLSVNGQPLSAAPSDPGVHVALRKALTESREEVRGICEPRGDFTHTLFVRVDPDTPTAFFLAVLGDARAAGFDTYGLGSTEHRCGGGG